MKTNTLYTFIILGCVGLSPIAYADQGKGHNKFLKFFDANNDGTVTMEEFDISAAERFKRMDPDSNGKITQDEFRGYTKQRRTERMNNKFTRIDADNDNNISQKEYIDSKMKKAEKKFSRMDKDGNGIVNADEFAKCKGKKHRKNKGKRIFHHMDKNSDGSLSKTESYEAWSSWFKRIDANNDKVVTADEINAFRKMRRSGKK